jgi:adenylate kinase family enzyme
VARQKARHQDYQNIQRNPNPMIYAFVGPPACGKSTQAELLAQATGMRFVSVGRLLRQQAEHDPQYAGYLAKGELFPSEVIQELLTQLHDESPDNLIIDGALRRASQVDKLAALWGKDTIVVVLFDAADAILLQRAEDRHGEARTDTAEETTEHRIELYRNCLPGILDRIHELHIPVIEVSAEPDIQTIQHNLLTQLQPYALPTKN